jgi:HAD superfamily hydrolase (TIGR01549 family)
MKVPHSKPTIQQNKDCSIFENMDAIIFDFDGTLYNKKGFAFHLILHHLKDISLIRAERKTRHLLKGKDFNSKEHFYQNFFRQFSAVLKNKKQNEEYVAKWYFEYYLPMLTDTLKKYCQAREGAAHLLDYLNKSNLKVAVFSDYAAVPERMEAIGLSSCHLQTGTFCSLYSAEEFGALKPSPRPFIEIANQLQVSPTKVLIIGDREDTDGVGATNAGMQFLLLSDTNKKEFPNVITWNNLISNILSLKNSRYETSIRS